MISTGTIITAGILMLGAAVIIIVSIIDTLTMGMSKKKYNKAIATLKEKDNNNHDDELTFEDLLNMRKQYLSCKHIVIALLCVGIIGILIMLFGFILPNSNAEKICITETVRTNIIRITDEEIVGETEFYDYGGNGVFSSNALFDKTKVSIKSVVNDNSTKIKLSETNDCYVETIVTKSFISLGPLKIKYLDNTYDVSMYLSDKAYDYITNEYLIYNSTTAE